jgi:hypothetical protein
MSTTAYNSSEQEAVSRVTTQAEKSTPCLCGFFVFLALEEGRCWITMISTMEEAICVGLRLDPGPRPREHPFHLLTHLPLLPSLWSGAHEGAAHSGKASLYSVSEVSAEQCPSNVLGSWLYMCAQWVPTLTCACFRVPEPQWVHHNFRHKNKICLKN